MGVNKGIESSSKVIMPILLLSVLGIAIFALTISHTDETGVVRTGMDGLKVYVIPSFEGMTIGKLFTVLIDALGQLFFSLSVAMGIMIAYGSYTNNEINIVKSTAMVCFFDTVVALLAGLAIFPAVAHFDPSLLDGSKGVALMYIILPEVFESMGFIGKIISFAFFSMVTIAALTSIMSLYEVCTQFVIQKFHFNRKLSAFVVGAICLAVSVPVGISLGHVAILEESSPTLFGLDWLTFFDEVTNTVLMPVCALLGCIAVHRSFQPRKLDRIDTALNQMDCFLAKTFPHIFMKHICRFDG